MFDLDKVEFKGYSDDFEDVNDIYLTKMFKIEAAEAKIF